VPVIAQARRHRHRSPSGLSFLKWRRGIAGRQSPRHRPCDFGSIAVRFRPVAFKMKARDKSNPTSDDQAVSTAKRHASFVGLESATPATFLCALQPFMSSFADASRSPLH